MEKSDHSSWGTDVQHISYISQLNKLLSLESWLCNTKINNQLGILLTFPFWISSFADVCVLPLICKEHKDFARDIQSSLPPIHMLFYASDQSRHREAALA